MGSSDPTRVIDSKLEHQVDAGPSKDVAAENLLENLNCDTSNCISSDGEMVNCDLCNKWFHPKCLKLKRLPTTKVWYCPTCRKIKKFILITRSIILQVIIFIFFHIKLHQYFFKTCMLSSLSFTNFETDIDYEIFNS